MLVSAALPPIPQDPGYHRLADGRDFFGIPNFLDVASSFAFAVAGIAGILWSRGAAAYTIFFGAVALSAFGSAYYHLAPDDARLVWDRLPMAIGFTALVAAVIGERVSPRAGRWLLIPLMLLGAASIVWWRAANDLRPYALVQFGSLIIVVLTLVLYRGRGTPYLASGLALYGLAKLFEAADAPIFEAGGIVSGHTLKHLVAAAGVFCVAVMQRVTPRTPSGAAPE